MACPIKIKWLLLIHQIPSKPDYFRVKILRRLQQIGALPIKSSVYVLPHNEQTEEDMLWIFKEIIGSRGEASLSEALFIEGLSDEQLTGMFQTARNADYQHIVKKTRDLTESFNRKECERKSLAGQFHKLKKQFQHIVSIDFFNAPASESAKAAVSEAEAFLKERPCESRFLPDQNINARIWVTRKGIYIDRIASVWLIRRFIDPNARFKFVSAKSYLPKENELRFDMADAEFTHENDLCTFEVLRERFCSEQPALIPIAEIIHDMDLKDEKFQRTETPGITAMFSGIVMLRTDDESRIEQGSVILDSLYEYFSKHH